MRPFSFPDPEQAGTESGPFTAGSWPVSPSLPCNLGIYSRIISLPESSCSSQDNKQLSVLWILLWLYDSNLFSRPVCTEGICDHAMLFSQIYVFKKKKKLHLGSSRGMLSHDIGWLPGSNTFSLLYSLQHSSSLVLRGTLPPSVNPSGERHSSICGCDKSRQHTWETSTGDTAREGRSEEGGRLRSISSRRRARW